MGSPPSSALQIIRWEDIFVVIDDGRALPHEYVLARDLIVAQADRFPGGIGCMAIIPRNASPPSDAAREALNVTLRSVAGTLRCLCWLVEGSGFQAAMVRAVLTGFRLIAKRSYPTHISTSMDEALRWMLSQLASSPERSSDAAVARREIGRQRGEEMAQGESRV